MSLMLTNDAPVHTLQQSQHSISTASHVQAAQPLSTGMSSLQLLRAQRSEHLVQAPEVARGLAPKSGVKICKEPGWRGSPTMQCYTSPGLLQQSLSAATASS